MNVRRRRRRDPALRSGSDPSRRQRASPEPTYILELLLRYQSQPIIESMVDDLFGPTGRHINPLNLKGPALSLLLGISGPPAVSERRAARPLGTRLHRQRR